MAGDDDFSRAVEEGLKLSKRINYGGEDRRQAAPPPRPTGGMERLSTGSPPAPMVCAVIDDPDIVDNPDIPSYQPYIYGRCSPPALIPLHMTEVSVQADCFLDTAFVALRGRWRVHCVTRSRRTDCRLVIPMGEQGSVLGVDVEIGRTSYSTQVIDPVDEPNIERMVKDEGEGSVKLQPFSLTIPQVNGGSDISLTVRWSQKLTYKDGQFSIMLPFSFPDYVNPLGKIFSKKEKIQINLNSGIGNEASLRKMSHPFKEKKHQEGNFALFYEANVGNWSCKDIYISYNIHSSDTFGGIILESPKFEDRDQRDMFFLYLFPGNNHNTEIFRKEVVFVIDISASMNGKPLENVKSALLTALQELTDEDCFDIIAFNDEFYSFSPCLEPATEEMIEKANQWISKNLVAQGGTDIMHPLNEAIGLLSSTQDACPLIFLVTDGSVDDERGICDTVRTHLTNRGYMAPRVSTFGIGTYCNHYFLRMLASIGRGQYDASYDADSFGARMEAWFERTSSPIISNITIDTFKHLDELEVYPLHIPDLSAGCPLIISGRSNGKFPNSVILKGSVADKSDFCINLKVQYTKDFPFDKVFAQKHIDLLTAQAWFSEGKQLKEKVTKLSIRCSIPSEYTYMVLCQTATESSEVNKQMTKTNSKKESLPAPVRCSAVGFGDRVATRENLPAGVARTNKPELLEAYNKAVNCCNKLCDCCCCMCFLNFCSKLNNQCAVAMTNLCAALSFLSCFECCAELCCSG